MTHALSIIVWCIYFTLLFSCSNKQTRFVNPAKDSAIVASKISISKLAKNISSMHGKYVEIEGKFSLNFEDVALYDYGLFSNNKTCFWLDISDKLGSSEDLDKLNGEKVMVKGRVNVHEKGHMGYYLATLEDVYYIVQK